MRFSLLAFNDPKKMIAGLIFILTFLAFLWEIISGFYATRPIKIGDNPLRIIRKQGSVHSNSALFTTALFGDYVPINLSDADIKQSMLNLQVVGIMFSAKESDSQVIIRAKKEEKYYVVGDTLPGGAVIKRILENAVVVLHNGVLESLSLPKNELAFSPPAKPLLDHYN
jgi:general secretion pathway protein C